MNDVTYKQVIVMRTDLNMRKGKMIAQGAHASSWFMVDYLLQGYTIDDRERAWMLSGCKTICVQVGSEKELQDIADKADAAGLDVHVVEDEGHTEFKGVPTLTCLAIGPNPSDKIDEITGHLKLL